MPIRDVIVRTDIARVPDVVNHALPSAPARSIASPPATRQTSFSAPSCPVAVVLNNDDRHSAAGRDEPRLCLTTVHCDAHDDRHDAVSRAPSSPMPLAGRNTTSPSATVTTRGTSWRLYNETTPRTNSAHHLTPHSPLIIHTQSLAPIWSELAESMPATRRRR